MESSKFILLDLLDFLSSLVDFLCHLTTVDERTSGEEVLKDVLFLKYLPLSSVFFKASAGDGDGDDDNSGIGNQSEISLKHLTLSCRLW